MFVALSCSALKHVAVRCSVVHCRPLCCIAVCRSIGLPFESLCVLQCVAVYCSVLQCGAVRCSALQYQALLQKVSTPLKHAHTHTCTKSAHTTYTNTNTHTYARTPTYTVHTHTYTHTHTHTHTHAHTHTHTHIHKHKQHPVQLSCPFLNTPA